MHLSSFSRILATALITVATLAFSGFIHAADVKPSATVTITETQVGFLLSGEWGHGPLQYQGEPHMFHMTGGKLGGIGITKSEIKGKVFYLDKKEDFEGVYFKADAGITLVEGIVGGSWLKNSNGVVLHFSDDSEGVALDVSAGGLKISF